MQIHDLIRRMRALFSDFRDPATAEQLQRLQAAVGPLPDDVLALYRDHDGMDASGLSGDTYPPARLLPIDEAIETKEALAPTLADTPRAGDAAWLWTDDNSNYVGVYTSGPLHGWLVKMNHEETSLAPAYRGVAGFIERLIASAPGVADEAAEACDAVMIPWEVPVVADDPRHVDGDRQLAAHFRALSVGEADADRRRFYATCAICLTPAADTATVLPYLAEDDTWLPESAVRLLELRGFTGGIDELERLARDGRINGDAAAMRLLVRLDTDAARAAVARLATSLTGQKLNTLQWTVTNRHRFRPPRWA